VYLALVILHAMRIRYIVMWPAPLCNIFPHYLTNGTILEREREKKVIEHKMCFDLLYNFCWKHFSL